MIDNSDMEAFDKLSEEWRHRLSECPFYVSAEFIFFMIEDQSEDEAFEWFEKYVEDMANDSDLVVDQAS